MKFFLLVMSVFVGVSAYATNLHLCGDSIMADYSARNPRPCYGWGEYVQGYCRDNVRVLNHAVPGSSTHSWLNGNLWKRTLDGIQKGDYVLLGFGLNDGDEKNPAAYCNEADFVSNLLRMASDVRKKGGTPLFVTTTAAYQETSDARERHARYNDAIRHAANSGKIELIELNQKFIQYMDALPDSGVLFVLKRKIPVKNWLDFDPVHLNENGARVVAEMVIAIIREKKLSVGALLK